MELRGGSEGQDDFNVFTVLNKYDHEGRRIPFYGTVGNKEDVITKGYMRASMRELDEEKSTDIIPFQAFQRYQKLSVGEVICLEVPFPPTSVWFKAGESLELTLAAFEIFQSAPMMKDNSLNKGGRHVIHVGGEYDSYVQVPVIPARQD